jgi:hypothetical protein
VQKLLSLNKIAITYIPLKKGKLDLTFECGLQLDTFGVNQLANTPFFIKQFLGITLRFVNLSTQLRQI